MVTLRSNFLQVTLPLTLAWYMVTTWEDGRGDKVLWDVGWLRTGKRGSLQGQAGRDPFLTERVPWPFPLAVNKKPSFCFVCRECGERRGVRRRQALP